MISVFHYRVVTTETDPDYFLNMDGFLAQIDTSTFKTSFLAACPNEYTLDNIFGQKVSPTRQVFRYVAAGDPGTGGAGNPAQNANAVITKQTDRVSNHTKGVITNRGGVGELHIPGIPTAMAAGGLITAPYSIILDFLAGDMLDNVTTVGGFEAVPCLWHRKYQPQPSSDDLIGATPKTEVRVMRRRTVGRGI